MLYEDQTEQLIGGLFAVQNEVRTGKGEENYHQAYKIWLEENDIPYTSKKDHPVVLNRKVVHTLQPDIVVWDSIIIELKAKSRRLIDGDFIQLFEYLKYRGDRLGLLVNMGLDRVYFERVIYEQPEYALMKTGITGQARSMAWSARRETQCEKACSRSSTSTAPAMGQKSSRNSFTRSWNIEV